MDPQLTNTKARTSSPLYQQIYWHIKNAVSNGVLQTGDRIPSARATAKEWGVARGTAEEAYQLLKDEGIIIAKGPAGCFIAPINRAPANIEPRNISVPAEPSSGPNWFKTHGLLPFQMGIPALDGFPLQRWQKLGREVARATTAQDLCNPPRQGLQELREQIAKYLAVARGVEASDEQIFITSGYRQSLGLIASAIGGQQAWVEDPGYPPTRETLGALGYQCMPVAVDAMGLNVELGLARAPDASLCVVTPAHQSPLCCSLSLGRRQALLNWANEKERWIIEDDYDGEYRLAGRPLPSLKSLDTAERVIYMGTFSKVLVPAIRLAYIVVPPSLLQAVRAKQQALMDSQPLVTQKQLTAFMATGQFTRHIQKMRKLYRERRTLCVTAFNTVFDGQLTIEDQPGGMHFVVRLDPLRDDQVLAQRCLDAGIYANPLSYWCITNHQPGLLMSYTNASNLEHTLAQVTTMKGALNL